MNNLSKACVQKLIDIETLSSNLVTAWAITLSDDWSSHFFDAMEYCRCIRMFFSNFKYEAPYRPEYSNHNIFFIIKMRLIYIILLIVTAHYWIWFKLEPNRTDHFLYCYLYCYLWFNKLFVLFYITLIALRFLRWLLITFVFLVIMFYLELRICFIDIDQIRHSLRVFYIAFP